MKVTIDGQEYWTIREYLTKVDSMTLPDKGTVMPEPDGYGYQNGCEWEIADYPKHWGAPALYRANRKDIMAIPEVRATPLAAERGRVQTITGDSA